MTTYQPLQQTAIGTGKWHMTWSNSAGTFTCECCGFCGGHDTPEEARECWRLWQIENSREFTLSGQALPCKVCGAWTDKGLDYPPGMFTVSLCDEHRTKEHAEAATRPTPA